MNDWLKKRVEEHKAGNSLGIYSVCSAHPVVLEAAAKLAKNTSTVLLVESTCNQVNQDGGYTGLRPLDFVKFVYLLTDMVNLPRDRIIFGGDHLGPYPWRNLPINQAMDKARELIVSYMSAGYKKIHIDTSMKCKDDPPGPLKITDIAQRSAELCKVAEMAIEQHNAEYISYVIGSEVPLPGGLTGSDQLVRITEPDEVAEMLNCMRDAFRVAGLNSAWSKIKAIVVQPGIEYGNESVEDYNSELALPLSRFIEGIENLVYEAHSTDYQSRHSLRSLVRDHFMVLKVGPALTYKYREALFNLVGIEENLYIKGSEKLSRLIDVIEQVMMEKPLYWTNYYSGNKQEARLAALYSFSDRIRYYWPDQRIRNAINRLINNLSGRRIPLSLLSQYFPIQYQKVRDGTLENHPLSLVMDNIQTILCDYHHATEGES